MPNNENDLFLVNLVRDILFQLIYQYISTEEYQLIPCFNFKLRLLTLIIGICGLNLEVNCGITS